MDYRRIVKQIVVGVAVAVLASTAQADTIYVDDDNCPGPGSGTPGDPYCSIQTAIANAVDTDEITVAPGTYLETIDFLGRAITLRSSGGPEVTIIDAQQTGATVFCYSGEGPSTVLDGFTITGGYFGGGAGGGMFNWESSPTVANCTFNGNWAEHGAGGGMANWGGSPTVTDCTFSGNSAAYGGGMCNFSGGSPTVVNCTFTGNGAEIGGGMCNFGDGSPTVTDCTFRGNSANADGGGMYNSSSSLTVIDCAFSDNSAGSGGNGGGMYNYESSPTVIDCRFERNTADDGNGGGIMTEAGNPLIIDSFFCENTPDHIWGDWVGDDNTFRMFCLPFPFDSRDDAGAGDVVKPLSR